MWRHRDLRPGLQTTADLTFAYGWSLATEGRARFCHGRGADPRALETPVRGLGACSSDGRALGRAQAAPGPPSRRGDGR